MADNKDTGDKLVNIRLDSGGTPIKTESIEKMFDRTKGRPVDPNKIPEAPKVETPDLPIHTTQGNIELTDEESEKLKAAYKTFKDKLDSEK